MNIEPNPSVATSARTRRTVVSVAIAVIATIPIATGSSGASDDPRRLTRQSRPCRQQGRSTRQPTPSNPTSAPASSGTLFASRSPFPTAGRTTAGSWLKSNSDPIFGAILDRVGNIFSDPCQWVEIDPPVGPTVDDLAAAFADVPALNATAPTDVTVDGYHGKQIEFTVPDYTDDECIDGRFALFQDPELAGRSQLLGARPPRPPSTVDPRRRRHPPGDRRHVLPGHLPAGPRRPRHDPQLHPNRPRRADESADERQPGS